MLRAMRILICGGGIAGLTLALCLERRGHEPIVVEAAAAPREEGYMIDFFASGYDACEKLGLLPELEALRRPVSSLRSIGEDGRTRLVLPYELLRERVFAGRHVNFLRGDLEGMLWRQIEGRVDTRFASTVAAYEDTGDAVEVELGDGSRETVDLLVGADGVHSHVRSLAFGPEERFARPLGYHTAAFVVPQMPAGLGDPEAFTTMAALGRQVAVYPLAEGRLATFFVHRADDSTHGLSRPEIRAELERIYGDLDWVVPALLEAIPVTGEIYFDDVTQIELPRWHQGRVALVGDACQCVSLTAGQGASMAVAAAYVLAEELGSGAPLADALARYQERCQPAIERKQAAGRRVARWFVPDSRLRRAIRDATMRLATMPVASSFLRQRMGAESIFHH